MPSQATAGYGTVLKAGPSGSLVAIAELTSISGPGLKLKTIDVTNMGTSGGVSEYIAGILDSGTLQIEGNFISDTSQTAVITALQAKTLQSIEVDFAGTHKLTGSAYWTEFSPDFKVTDRITFKASLQFSGTVTFD